jgi:hypothetical protein
MKDFEINMRDAGEFDRWKREMDEKEEIERLEHIQKKKIEMSFHVMPPSTRQNNSNGKIISWP